jgi:prepilin-type N-terminal cleavage/methylation domain-containing protein
MGIFQYLASIKAYLKSGKIGGPPTQVRQRRMVSGFTIIEMIVVLGIVSALTTILVGYTRQSTKQLLLSSKEAEILSLVSRAKFLSIETFFEDLGGSGTPRKTCAYGINVDKTRNEIFIFQDRAPAVPGCSIATNKYELGQDGKLDVVTIDTDTMSLGGDLQDIVYIPPDPTVIINAAPSKTSATIEINLTDGSGGFTVILDNAGQVRAQ